MSRGTGLLDRPATADPVRPASFAVVLRTYQWDDFIERQVARYRLVSGGGDLFLSLDETRGTLSVPSRENVLSTKDGDLVSSGLPNRFGRGSLIWWNNDYPQYAFHQAHPDYDYYVFVEYDSLIRTPIRSLIDRVASRHLDFVAEPIPDPLEHWFWWQHTRRTYENTEIRATLNCISIVSNRALRFLLERRMAMARDEAVRRWPISEAFGPTELGRAGYAMARLSEFGDTSTFNWFPPLLEGDLDGVRAGAFIHPVLDPPRYVDSLLKNGAVRGRSFLDPSSEVRRRLARVPFEAYGARLPTAAWQTFRRIRKETLERRLSKLGLLRSTW